MTFPNAIPGQYRVINWFGRGPVEPDAIGKVIMIADSHAHSVAILDK